MLLMHVSHIHLYKAVAPYRTGVCVFDRTVQTLDSSSEYLPALSEAVTTLSTHPRALLKLQLIRGQSRC